jgi:hypothetical protein
LVLPQFKNSYSWATNVQSTTRPNIQNCQIFPIDPP